MGGLIKESFRVSAKEGRKIEMRSEAAPIDIHSRIYIVATEDAKIIHAGAIAQLSLCDVEASHVCP